METLQQRFQELLQRFLDWWRGMTGRQRALIISAIAVVITAIGILIFVVSRPNMVFLVEADSAEQSQTIQNLLTDNNITFKRSDDAMKYYVDAKQKGDADILLGTNAIPASGYTIDDALNGSFTTTEADKKKTYQVYLEKKYETILEGQENIASADVTLNIPDDDGTLIANEQDSYASIQLEVVNENSIEDKNAWAAGLAKFIATTLGNDDTGHITIVDKKGNVLFAGGEELSAAGSASSNFAVKTQAENIYASKVRTALASAANDGSIYDNASVAVELDLDFDTTKKTKYDYSVDDGRTEGYLDSEHYETTESTEGITGVPGTDTNADDTTYVMPDNQNSSSSSEAYDRDYLPDEEITETVGNGAKIIRENSSVAVSATRYVVYNEDAMKAAGQLEEMTFDEFVAQNSANVETEVDPTVITAVSRATGIPEANIIIKAYDVPMFQYSKSGRDITDYIQIAIALLVFLLLGFVVLRTLKKEEEEAVEEEVTVEDLLDQAREEELEEIGVNDKSEARLLIEKFVDENPEAVANLLRNWLNEDWG